MGLLLDTHVWIWSQEQPERLGPETRRRLLESGDSLFVSAVSTLEIAHLVSSGRIRLDGVVLDWVKEAADALHALDVPVTHEIAAGAYTLPGRFHKDPADRLLVATARVHHLTLVTADERILRYRHVASQDAGR